MTDQINISTYPCHHCGNTFSNDNALKEHIKSHEAPTSRLSPTFGDTGLEKQPSVSSDITGSSTDLLKHRLDQLANDSESDDEPAPVKQGRGRPRKDASYRTKQSTDGSTSVKRKRGRPRKDASHQSDKGINAPVKISSERPPKDTAHQSAQGTDAPVKRGRGRPKKDASHQPDQGTNAPVKRSSERPPKDTAHQSAQSTDASVKRGPGRPRKHASHQTDKGTPKVKQKPGRQPNLQLLDGENISMLIKRKPGRPPTKKTPDDNHRNSRDINLTPIVRNRSASLSSRDSYDSFFDGMDKDENSESSQQEYAESVDSFTSNETPFGGIGYDGISEPRQQSFNGNAYDGTQLGSSDGGGLNNDKTSIKRRRFHGSSTLGPTFSDLDSVGFNESASVNTLQQRQPNFNESNLTSDQTSQFTTWSQFQRRPFQLGDRSTPWIDTSSSPSTFNTTHLFSDNDDTTSFASSSYYNANTTSFASNSYYNADTTSFASGSYDRTTNDNGRMSVQTQAQDLDNRHWIEDLVERDLVQRPNPPPTKFEFVYEQDHLQSKNNLQPRTSLLDNLRRQNYLANMYPPPLNHGKPTPELLTRLKPALVHSFINALYDRGIRIPTYEHKVLMVELYHAIEQHFPPIDSTPDFEIMMTCIEDSQKARNDLKNLVYDTKKALTGLVKSIQSIPVPDAMAIADQEDAVLVDTSSRKPLHAFLARFRAKHPITEAQAKTAAEIDRYALQLKKYPTHQIIPFKL